MIKQGAVNVGGLMYANSETGLQRTIAIAMRSKLGVGPSKFHTGGSAGESDTVYLGTFKKSAVITVSFIAFFPLPILKVKGKNPLFIFLNEKMPTSTL